MATYGIDTASSSCHCPIKVVMDDLAVNDLSEFIPLRICCQSVDVGVMNSRGVGLCISLLNQARPRPTAPSVPLRPSQWNVEKNTELAVVGRHYYFIFAPQLVIYLLHTVFKV